MQSTSSVLTVLQLALTSVRKDWRRRPLFSDLRVSQVETMEDALSRLCEDQAHPLKMAYTQSGVFFARNSLGLTLEIVRYSVHFALIDLVKFAKKLVCTSVERTIN